MTIWGSCSLMMIYTISSFAFFINFNGTISSHQSWHDFEYIARLWWRRDVTSPHFVEVRGNLLDVRATQLSHTMKSRHHAAEIMEVLIAYCVCMNKVFFPSISAFAVDIWTVAFNHHLHIVELSSGTLRKLLSNVPARWDRSVKLTGASFGPWAAWKEIMVIFQGYPSPAYIGSGSSNVHHS